jgi:hypothetical protein
MDACCNGKEELKILRGRHKNALTIVLVINTVLFLCANNLSHLNHIIGGKIAAAGVNF